MARGPLGLFISQRRYALEIVEKCGLLGSKPVDFPIEENHKLALTTRTDLDDPSHYRHLIRRLIYLTIIQPEPSYVMHILSQFIQNPKEAHMDAARCVLRYLKDIIGYDILLRKPSSTCLL